MDGFAGQSAPDEFCLAVYVAESQWRTGANVRTIRILAVYPMLGEERTTSTQLLIATMSTSQV